jgi:hypothetical protein
MVAVRAGTCLGATPEVDWLLMKLVDAGESVFATGSSRTGHSLDGADFAAGRAEEKISV